MKMIYFSFNSLGLFVAPGKVLVLQLRSSCKLTYSLRCICDGWFYHWRLIAMHYHESPACIKYHAEVALFKPQ